MEEQEEYIVQGSAQWHAQRLGFVTASRFADVIGASKPNKNLLAVGFSTTAETYAWELLAEMITKLPATFSAPATDWGHAYEDLARKEYERVTGEAVVPCGFLEVEPFIGGSPDGMTGDQESIIEIKCPYSTVTHLRTLKTGEVPSEHIPQIQGNLWITDAYCCSFISFDPRCEHSTQLFIKTIYRDDTFIATLISKVRDFRDLVLAEYQRITGSDEFVVTEADQRRIDEWINAKPWERQGMFLGESE